MVHKIDLYNNPKKLANMLTSIEKCETICAENKALLKKFTMELTAKGLSYARRLKYLYMLRILARFVKKDFRSCEKDDLLRYINHMESAGFSVATKHDNKVIIKIFYRWLSGDESDYPPIVKWISTAIAKCDTRLPAAGELLKEEEVKLLIETAYHARDKALVSMLYESGCRIGELLSMPISAIQPDRFGVHIVVYGKTGSRKIRLISSCPYLMAWLEQHPKRKRADAPLWVSIGNPSKGKHMMHGTVRKLLQNLFKRAGVEKRCNPHFFRHSRATHLANHLTEFQMNQYFGWRQGSNMPSTYVHLSGKQVDDAILRMHGITKQAEKKEEVLKPQICARCDTINTHDSKFCRKCAGVLNQRTAMEEMEKEKKVGQYREKIFASERVQRAIEEEMRMRVLAKPDI